MSPLGEPRKDAKMTARNIRNPSDRAALIARGYAWATVRPRGEFEGPHPKRAPQLRAGAEDRQGPRPRYRRDRRGRQLLIRS